MDTFCCTSSNLDEELDLAEISTFLRVVEAGSYSKAAETLHTTKSSVSRRISRLEARLGVRLFARTTRSLRLTEEGAAFHARVGSAVEEVHDAARAVRDLGGRPQGLLRVTAPSDLPFLGELVAEFMVEFPEITVDLLLTQRTVDLVGEGYDVAVRAGPLRDSTLVARGLIIGRLIVAASPTYLAQHGRPETVEDLAQHRCVTFNAPNLSQTWTLRGPDGRCEVAVRGPVNTNVFNMVCDLALAGAGVAMMPEIMIQDALQDGRLERLLPDHELDVGPLHVVFPGGRHLSRKVRVFCDFAQHWAARRLEA